MNKPAKYFWGFPSLFSEVFDYQPLGLSVHEDKESVYVQAQAPGVPLKDITLEYEEGYLRIHAEKKQEEKEKKYYRKSQNVFSYALHVPGQIDQDKNPKAELKQGILTITFPKLEEKKFLKRIAIQEVE